MSKEERQLRQIIEQWRTALESRDVESMMTDYMPDAVLFDCVPPYKTVGAEAIKALWRRCLPFLPENFKSVHQDMSIRMLGQDAAVMTALHRMEWEGKPNTPAHHTWVRTTVVFQKSDDRWKVAHEHVSVPFNPMTGETAFILDPADLMCGAMYGC